MIDVQELLRKKESDIDRVRQEIHALQLVAPLLSDSDEIPTMPAQDHSELEDISAAPRIENASRDDQTSTEAETTEASSEPIPPKRGILRDWFSRAAGE